MAQFQDIIRQAHDINSKKIPEYCIINAISDEFTCLIEYYQKLDIYKYLFVDYYSKKGYHKELLELFPLSKGDINKNNIDRAYKNNWLDILIHYTIANSNHAEYILELLCDKEDIDTINAIREITLQIPYHRSDKAALYVIRCNMEDLIKHYEIKCICPHIFIEHETFNKNKEIVLYLLNHIYNKNKITNETIKTTILNDWRDLIEIYSSFNLYTSTECIDLLLEMSYSVELILKFTTCCSVNKLINIFNEGDLELVKQFLIFDSRGSNSSNFLEYLTINNYYEMIKLFNKYCNQSEIVIMHLIKNGHFNLVTSDKKCITNNIFNYAIINNKLDIVKYYHEIYNFTCDDESLISICIEGYEKMVKFLLVNNFKFPDDCLEIAAQNNNFDIMILLISHNKNTPTAKCLESAIIFGNLDMVTYLTSYGIEFPYNSIEIAEKYEHVEIVNYLLTSSMVKLQEIDECNLEDFIKYGDVDKIKYLLDKGMKLDNDIIDKVLNSRNNKMIDLILNYNYDNKEKKFNKKLVDLIKNYNMEKIIFYVENGYKFGEEEINLATDLGHYDIVEFLFMNLT